jgi:mono/diheme cytochrome c family protein
MRTGGVVAALQVALAIGSLATGLAGAAPALEPVEPPPRASFDGGLIARGAELSAIGNCRACHTADEGKSFAGGRALKTAFGTIYGTNITPDPQTGIGRWSEMAFRRALHEGVDREGRDLYPAFPYDHFTLLTDADVSALYAFMMTRDPVTAKGPPNALAFPFNVRSFITIWKSLYFRAGRFQPNPAQSAEWNRGAYLTEGAGHCGACHTPRNMLGAERRDRHLAGGETESWHAPALNAESPSPVPWTATQLDTYLRTGIEDDHAIAAGPMASVSRNLATVSPEDTRAIAVYVASLIDPQTAEARQRGEEALAQARRAASTAPRSDLDRARMASTDQARPSGAALYADTCAGCHDAGRDVSSGGALHLSLAIAPALPAPTNLIHLTLEGIAPADGEPGRWMPGFAGALTPDQVSALVRYVRVEFGKRPAWHNVDEEVTKVVNEIGTR